MYQHNQCTTARKSTIQITRDQKAQHKATKHIQIKVEVTTINKTIQIDPTRQGTKIGRTNQIETTIPEITTSEITNTKTEIQPISNEATITKETEAKVQGIIEISQVTIEIIHKIEIQETTDTEQTPLH